MDDKLLGEKTHYYCSSSEDEGEDESDTGSEGKVPSSKGPTFIAESQLKETSRYSTNTGPKGVLEDWRRFKQLETESKVEQEAERLALMKKLSVTCRSHLDDEKEKQKDEAFAQQIEENFEDLEDEFIKQYRQKRLEEMRHALQNVPKFGKVVTLDAGQFVEAIDNEKPCVTIIVHVYEKSIPACEAMNGCLMCLATEYPAIKFCQLEASRTRLSSQFTRHGVPALLIYKAGDMIGNFVGLGKEFGEDFFATDVESFLQEHGFLPTKDKISSVIRGAPTPQDDSDDSDFDVD